jgi:hypothetical protein
VRRQRLAHQVHALQELDGHVRQRRGRLAHLGESEGDELGGGGRVGQDQHPPLLVAMPPLRGAASSLLSSAGVQHRVPRGGGVVDAGGEGDEGDVDKLA